MQKGTKVFAKSENTAFRTEMDEDTYFVVYGIFHDEQQDSWEFGQTESRDEAERLFESIISAKSNEVLGSGIPVHLRNFAEIALVAYSHGFGVMVANMLVTDGVAQKVHVWEARTSLFMDNRLPQTGKLFKSEAAAKAYVQVLWINWAVSRCPEHMDKLLFEPNPDNPDLIYAINHKGEYFAYIDKRVVNDK